MGMSSHLLASGPGWCVSDVICTAGPRDRPFEEKYDAVCIATVTHGTFRYRSTQGSAILAPGSVLLGNHGHCFECGHEHGVGDRCLSFHFAPEFLEAIVSAIPDARQTVFTIPCLPPLSSLVPLLAAAEVARDDGDGAGLEELGLCLAGAVVGTLAGTKWAARAPSRRDQRRVTDALRHIEAQSHERLVLADLAREAVMSPYHFLRVFQQVVGMTPHQFVLRTRLHRAAMRLRRSDESILAIALDVGFNDLSTFNRLFRRVMGGSPSACRRRDEAAAWAPAN
jgi:AraC family transcriptional regulator